uniref:AlNc14C363G11024 protein n=1 Tax=Albugo laibachii Nc14 TaxID=890382 RepID=F0WXT7_9STRA|nr:AlNc14C363G11024 [Albugo laibachii Nc14]|eukprot:CCA26285.1 AlNc14C363G11024 [Albugo laibachii Nc14]
MSEYADAFPHPTYCSDSSSVSHQDAKVSQLTRRDKIENEDDQIYYGFGVFIGLPLSELKAMKEEFMQKHAFKNGIAGSNSSHESANSDVSYSMDQEPQYISCDGQQSPRQEISNVCLDGEHEQNGAFIRHPTRPDGESVSRHDEKESEMGHEPTLGTKPHSLNFILH